MSRDTDQFITGLDYPMFVVTVGADRGRERAGCLVGFATQCGIDPFRFLVCLSVRNRTHKVAMAAAAAPSTVYVAVHVLARNQQDLAALFGSETGDEVDKFTRCEWRAGPGGVPLLARSVRILVGEVIGRYSLGDHTGLLLAQVETHCGQHGGPGNGPLMFSDLPPVEPGHPAGDGP